MYEIWSLGHKPYENSTNPEVRDYESVRSTDPDKSRRRLQPTRCLVFRNG